MLRISYHVSHEQFSPRELLELVRHAEAAGFDSAFSSDHIQPWLPEQDESGFVWAWLGAALQSTSRLSFAAITIPGGWRYHPAIVAQAIATLAQMFPGRLPWIALGSGEALNECVVGADWPDKPKRDARLQEAAELIRRLLRGECVTQDGHVPARNARIWSLPADAPALMGAALSEPTAAAAGKWADGLLTVAPSIEQLRRIVAAFQRNGAGKPMHAKVDLSWAPTDAEALRQAHEQWRFTCISKESLSGLRTPEEFAAKTRDIDPEQLRETVCVSADFEVHLKALRERAALGFQTLDLHNVGRNQHEFIEAFGKHVLPALKATRR